MAGARENPRDALLRLAGSFEKLADSIDERYGRRRKNDKTAADDRRQIDYGTLDSRRPVESDALTAFLLR